ncbi:MAG: PaaI family thioesterase, partial [Candidatus Zixiibacteriota bacterium]
LDEIMVKAILATGKVAVTAEMTVRYHRPVRIGDTLSFQGRITKQKGRIVLAEAEVVDTKGNTYATAVGKYAEVRGELKESIASSLSSDHE